MGSYSCKLTNYPVSHPTGDECLYQDIPSPSGQLDVHPPSGSDFAGKVMAFGCWVKGGGTIYLGHNDGTDHWSSGTVAPTDWEWTSYTFTTTGDATNLRALFCPVGEVYIDNVHAAFGTRLVSTVHRTAPADLDAWRRHNSVFNNREQTNIVNYGDVVIVSPDSYVGVVHPGYYGQGGVMGVAIADSNCGEWVGITSVGIAHVNVIGPVEYADLICTTADASYPGYGCTEEYVGVVSGVTLGSIYPFATAMEEKVGDGPGQILAFIHTKASRSKESELVRMRAIHLAPEYAGAVEGSLPDDDSGALQKGWDGEHNYYEWNWTTANDGREMILENVEASGAISIATDAFSITGSVIGTGINITSDEVYQEGLLVSEAGNMYGVNVERSKAKFLNNPIFESKWVEAATDPGEIIGAYSTTGLHARHMGAFAMGGPAEPTRVVGYDYVVGAPPTGNVVGSVDGTVPSGWSPVGFDLRNGVITGVLGQLQFLGTTGDLTGDMSLTGAYISGWVRKEGDASPWNSVVTRVPVPHDYLFWMSSGMHVWNRAVGSSSLTYRVYDTSGVEVVSVGPLTHSGWTDTHIDVPSGVFTPNEFLTIYTIFESNEDSSAYTGEMSLYYHNYSM